MNVIIVGCGKVGSELAEQLVDDGHSVTVIDSDREAVSRVTDSVDAMGVNGNGAIYQVLAEAGIEYADMFIAMTNSDELNLLCCVIAKRTTKCHTIARVRNPDYLIESEFIKEKLGLSMIVNPELSCAREIARLFTIPSATEVDVFEKGRIELLKTRLPENTPLGGTKIKNALGRLSGKVLICAIERNSQVIIPTGEDELRAGDKISFVTSRRYANAFFRHLGVETAKVRSVMLAGGGKITVYLATMLREYGFKIKIIEKDEQRCEYLASILPDDVLIICGDASDTSLLYEEGISEVDGFASITDFDEENIILSLFVESNFGIKTVTKVNRINLEDITERLNLSSVVHPKSIIAELVLSYIRAISNSEGSSVQTLYNIVSGKARALEFFVKKQSAAVGVPLSRLSLKKNLLICCIWRAGKMIIPTGSDSIMLLDTVIVVTTDRELNDLSDIVE